MGRLKQLNPNNYGSSRSIHDEFESLIRYLVAAEQGNKSYAELFRTVFDEDGEIRINVEFAFDADGLKMRKSEDAEWDILAGVEDLRGAPGRDIGNVALPILTGIVNYEATAGQTVFAYSHGPTDSLFVHHNGLLLTPNVSYTNNPVNGTFTLNAGATAGDVITAYKIRGDAGVLVQRTDVTVTAASQAVFGMVFPGGAYQVQIYLNGILLAENSDYILSPATSSLTLLEAAVNGDILTQMVLSTSGATEIPGFLLEGVYTDMETGLIRFERVGIPDDAIATEKVSGLTEHLASTAKITVGSGTPQDPVSGDFWLDTSVTPANLKIYDASEFVSVQPTSSLPTLRSSDAGFAIFVNSTGSGFSYRPIDFSALIPLNQKGQPGGVATLDEEGRLDPSQQPLVRTRDVISHKIAGDVANGTFTIRRLFGERFRIIGLSVKTGSGTCTVQLGISGAAIGTPYSAASAANDQTFTSVIEVDALVLSKTIDVIVTNEAAAADLDITAVIERLI